MHDLLGRRPSSAVLQARRREGAFSSLITRHLMDNDTLFKEYSDSAKSSEIRPDSGPRIVKLDEKIINFDQMIGQTEKKP